MQCKNIFRQGKISLLFTLSGYYLLGMIFLIIQGIAILLACACRLAGYLRYIVQCLRYPPPGGMYGNMINELKNRSDTPDK